MAIDFQICYPQEVIQLNRIRYSGFSSTPGVPVSLDITGQDFRAVDEVLINDIPSPDVIVINRNRLMAQLPDVLQKSLAVNSVFVTSRSLTLSQKSLIKFRIGNTPGRVSGVMRLMQLFLKVLFTTQGSDIFAPNIGGNGLTFLHETYGSDEGKGIVSSFVISVDTTVRQIVAIQGRDSRIPRDERLLKATVTKAKFNRNIAGIVASIEIISQAGRAATANLEL